MSSREKGSVTQCLGKKRYATKKFADKKAEEFTKKFDKQQRAYSCGICGGYHLTSKQK